MKATSSYIVLDNRFINLLKKNKPVGAVVFHLYQIYPRHCDAFELSDKTSMGNTSVVRILKGRGASIGPNSLVGYGVVKITKVQGIDHYSLCPRTKEFLDKVRNRQTTGGDNQKSSSPDPGEKPIAKMELTYSNFFHVQDYHNKTINLNNKGIVLLTDKNLWLSSNGKMIPISINLIEYVDKELPPNVKRNVRSVYPHVLPVDICNVKNERAPWTIAFSGADSGITKLKGHLQSLLGVELDADTSSIEELTEAERQILFAFYSGIYDFEDIKSMIEVPEDEILKQFMNLQKKGYCSEWGKITPKGVEELSDIL